MRENITGLRSGHLTAIEPTEGNDLERLFTESKDKSFQCVLYKWIYKAQNEMIMQLNLDYYGWQEKDAKGKILPYSTIMYRRHLAQAHPKYYLRKK